MIVLSSDCNTVNTKDSLYKIVLNKKNGNYCIVDDEDNIYGTYSSFKNAKLALREFFFSIKNGTSTFTFPSDKILNYF